MVSLSMGAKRREDGRRSRDCGQLVRPKAAVPLAHRLEASERLPDNGSFQTEPWVGPSRPYDYLYRTDRRRKYYRDPRAGGPCPPWSRDCRHLWNKRTEGGSAGPRASWQALL